MCSAGARTAHEHGVRVVLTPAPAQPLPPELLAVTGLLVPNEHEAAVLTGKSDPHDAAAALLAQVPEVVVTLGAEGSLWATRDAEPVHVPAARVKAEDTTAAGDTFVGALAVAVGEGRADAGGHGLGVGGLRPVRTASGRPGVHAAPLRDRRLRRHAPGKPHAS